VEVIVQSFIVTIPAVLVMSRLMNLWLESVPSLPKKLPSMFNDKKSKVFVTVPFKSKRVESLIMDPVLTLIPLIVKPPVLEFAVKSTNFSALSTSVC
jgi:hypothetical protein